MIQCLKGDSPFRAIDIQNIKALRSRRYPQIGRRSLLPIGDDQFRINRRILHPMAGRRVFSWAIAIGLSTSAPAINDSVEWKYRRAASQRGTERPLELRRAREDAVPD